MRATEQSLQIPGTRKEHLVTCRKSISRKFDFQDSERLPYPAVSCEFKKRLGARRKYLVNLYYLEGKIRLRHTPPEKTLATEYKFKGARYRLKSWLVFFYPRSNHDIASSSLFPVWRAQNPT